MKPRSLAGVLLKRLAGGLVSLFFLVLVTFIVDELAPGDAATYMAGEKATPSQVEQMRRNMGLDRPAPVRFVEYIGRTVRGDLGNSIAGAKEPVTQVIARALPMTIMIAVPAIIFAALVGILLGTLAAVNAGKSLDQGILAFSTLGVTLPNFVLAPILVFIFAVRMDQLPTTWETTLRAPLIYYLILPVLVLSARPAASLTRLTRAAMVEVLAQEFIKLAVAKGVPPLRLILVHGLKNALLPVITAIGTSFGFLLTGSFIVETIFVMPGMGFTAIDAIQRNDTPILMGCVLATGALFILVNLAVDLVMPLLDPRVREATA